MGVLKQNQYKEIPRSFNTSLISGALAGLVVDVTLFPLDTLKTRLQSQFGFWQSGGFRGIYKGIAPTAIGSAPAGAAFFTAYNGFKTVCNPHVTPKQEPVIHVIGAAIGEWTSCIVRVPTEIVKQRCQCCSTVGVGGPVKVVRDILKLNGMRGLYQGFWTTVCRDVPYAVIQFPLWEFFKKCLVISKGGKAATPPEGALCGAFAGAVAGAVTTPLDVVKTRLMLSVGYTTVGAVVSELYKEKGFMGFLSGFTPRVTWIFLGGYVFFGVYETACVIIDGE